MLHHHNVDSYNQHLLQDQSLNGINVLERFQGSDAGAAFAVPASPSDASPHGTTQTRGHQQAQLIEPGLGHTHEHGQEGRLDGDGVDPGGTRRLERRAG
jgi:hypothetical protein